MDLHSEYRSERISNSRLNDFGLVFKEAFGQDMVTESQRQKFDTLPVVGVADIGFLAYNHVSSEPAAYYGVYPVEATVNGQKLLICQSGDTMTRPSHGGKGLFIALAKQTYELCKENTICGVFGFPSKSSYPGFKNKLNWTFNELIQRFSFFVPTLPVGAVAEKVKYIRFFYDLWVAFVLLFYKKGVFFPGSIANAGQDGIVRNEKFWAYKMRPGKIKLIRIGGVDAAVKFNGKLSLGDLDITEETDIRKILRGLKLLAFLTFNTHIVFYVSPDTLLYRKLSMIRDSADALPSGFLNFSDQADLSSLKFTYFDFDTY